MLKMSGNASIVNFYGVQHDAKCLYCPKLCTKYGMWAYRMTAADYQDLLDGGWRRLGNYIAKTQNIDACCPCYTIRCDAKEFNFSKSHKKILKNMNNFLKNGQKANRYDTFDTDSLAESVDSAIESVTSDQELNEFDSKLSTEYKPAYKKPDGPSASDEIMLLTSKPKLSIDIDSISKLVENDDNKIELQTGETDTTVPIVKSIEAETSPIKNESGKDAVEKTDEQPSQKQETAPENDSGKPQQKAKFLRMQRKAQKMARGNTAELTMENIKKLTSEQSKQSKNEEKTLKSFVDETPTDGIHRLKLVLLNIESEEFERSRNIEFDLYRRYQTKIHLEPPVDMCEFNNYICTSPIRHEKPENGPESGYGTFHQQYWLDDRLIAVGVIDILPRGISSVYYFYDPSYTFLTLGTYGILREIEFIQQMNKTCPELRGYYIGYYVPCVPKMLYKGKLQPSYILCPETNTFHPLDESVLKLLEHEKNSRFHPDPNAKPLNEFDPKTDISYLRILVDNKLCLPYNKYKEYKHTDEGNDEDFETFSEYGKSVGKTLSRRMYLVV